MVRLDKVEVREREGASFTVACTTEGFPEPVRYWSRETGGLFRLGVSVDQQLVSLCHLFVVVPFKKLSA
ncbi:unnamed protein product [Protopolystoma xenopodis]|uniref:Ig-like domain-containing protein n=1 Tax=Protopolystoma xenopodis TaxID=117903 RepID=A0A3S5BVS5_9PLAT|nr:unnamed protein product [Protopolystoma xenopodis]